MSLTEHDVTEVTLDQLRALVSDRALTGAQDTALTALLSGATLTDAATAAGMAANVADAAVAGGATGAGSAPIHSST